MPQSQICSTMLLGPEDLWFDTVKLLQQLIRLYPSYASTGQTAAFFEVMSYLDTHQCGVVVMDEFSAEEIATNPYYVPVESFADLYSNYRQIPKQNVLAVLDGNGNGPTIILNGHLDVDLVSTPELWSQQEGWRSGEIRNGYLEGRGATDMLSGVCCLLYCVAVMAQSRSHWRGRIIFTAVCDEEIGGNGTLRALLYLSERKYLKESCSALIAEPSSGLVCDASLGFLPFKVNLRRRTVHMGVATRCNSVFEDLVALETKIEERLYQIFLAAKPELKRDSVRCNLGILHGGVDPALPLGSILIEGTLFLPFGISTTDANAALQSAIHEIVRRDTKFQVNLGSTFFLGSQSPEHPLFNALLSERQNLPIQRGLFPSPCDARLFQQFSIPTTIYGPGDLSQAHSVDERIRISTLRPYCEHVLRALQNVLGWR